jgi:gamma-glutamyl hercynylcysteine S-oxide synthase
MSQPLSALDSQTDLKERLAAGLDEARRRTLSLLEPVPDEELVRQHSPLMSPLVWDLAHIGVFEELWLLQRVAGTEPLVPELAGLYDAFEHARAERARLSLMDPARARAYLAEVRGRTLDVLERADFDSPDPLLADAFVYRMVIQHEHQHCETLLATLQLCETAYPLAEQPAPPGRPLPTAEVYVDGGPFEVGTDRDPWAYDNERPAHEAEVAPFFIDAAPVTNRAYAEFVADGGYEDERLWTGAGWEWKQKEAVALPQFWHRAGESWARVRLGHVEALPPDEPVQHVCWYEADAFARWAGKRLPTELEWEKAASWADGTKRRYPWGDTDPGGELANLAPDRFGPAEAGAFPAGASADGAEQLIGDVWEWTSSDFLGYPGFLPFPYREYSEVFFGGEYKVLRGGSWATHPTAVRSTFRNWDYPIRRQIFAGFRCARDA